MTISAVVPTYNRGPALRQGVRLLLANDFVGLNSVEILVVDDGSTPPAEMFLSGLDVHPPFALSVLRQANGGPARARNTGFRRASANIVLFVDDDVLAPPDLLRGHVAAHRERPGSVVFGRCPWLPPPVQGAVFRFLEGLGYDAAEGASERYLDAPVVASGQISVERSMFDPASGVYRDHLVTPAAEEYELSLRLRRRGVPILLATWLTALHDSATDIAALCQQQYKHGLGCAEAARRCPETLELDELARIIKACSSAEDQGAALHGRLRALAASRLARRALLGLARGAEALAPQLDALRPLYRGAIAAYFSAGVRAGLRRFSGAAS